MTRRRGDGQLWPVTPWCPAHRSWLQKLHKEGPKRPSAQSCPGHEAHTAPPLRDRAGVSQDPGHSQNHSVTEEETEPQRSSRTCPRVMVGSRLPTHLQSCGFLGTPGVVFGPQAALERGQERRPQTPALRSGLVPTGPLSRLEAARVAKGGAHEANGGKEL